MPTLADILSPVPSPLYKEGAVGMAQHPDMARIGPQAWAELHAWAERLRAQVGDSCGCGEFAVMGARSFHDLVNYKLGRSVKYGDDLKRMAREYEKAAEAVEASQEEAPDAYGSRCRDPKTGEWVFSDLCPPVEEIVSPGRVILVPPATATNRTLALSADGLRTYEFEHRVVESDRLIPSHNPFTFEVNPAFTQSLQPRQRDRAAAEIQVRRIAAQLSPDSLLTDFHTLDRGAPIVGPDMLVESGNGRVMGILRAIGEFPENYAAYRAVLEAKAPEYGLTTRGFMSPVLVRVRLTPLSPQERQAFVLEANTPAGLSRSAIEQARTDGEKITLGMLDSLEIAEGESIFDALRAGRNAGFMRAFMDNVPENERGQLLDAKGVVNMDGVRRAAQAIFVSAFGSGEAGTRLGAMAFESVDQDVRTAINAVSGALGPIAKMEAMLRARVNGSDLSLSTDLAQAISVYARIKNDPALTVEKYLAQAQMLERELSPSGEAILTTLDRHRRSAKRMSAVLRAYANLVINLPPPEQGGLFGPVEPPSRESLWGRALEMSDAPVLVAAQQIVFRPMGAYIRERMQSLENSISEGEMRLRSRVNGIGERQSAEELRATLREVARAKEELAELKSEYAKHQPRGSFSSRIRWCNTPADAQGRVMAWRPLRNLIYMGVGYQVAVEVCEAGFGGHQYQVTIGYPQEGAIRKGTLTTGQMDALRRDARSLGTLAREVLTKDRGLLVWNVTLPGDEPQDLVLRPQFVERTESRRPDPTLQPSLFQEEMMEQRDGWTRGKKSWEYGRGKIEAGGTGFSRHVHVDKGIRSYYAEVRDTVDGNVEAREEFDSLEEAQKWVERKVHRVALSQSFLDTIVNSALATATSIGVAKALSASVVPGGVQPAGDAPLYKEGGKDEKDKDKPKEKVMPPVIDVDHVQGDQAQVEGMAGLLTEIDALLQDKANLGEVDADRLEVTRQ